VPGWARNETGETKLNAEYALDNTAIDRLPDKWCGRFIAMMEIGKNRIEGGEIVTNINLRVDIGLIICCLFENGLIFVFGGIEIDDDLLGRNLFPGYMRSVRGHSRLEQEYHEVQEKSGESHIGAKITKENSRKKKEIGEWVVKK
jgi:hypothetical protein